MKNSMSVLLRLKENKGVSAVLVAIMIAMFLGFAALAIDVGYGFVTKNQLHNIADAAALAAARQLGVIYQGLSYEEQQTYVVDTADEAQIKNAAIAVASQNQAGGVSITINSTDIQIGVWDLSYTPDASHPRNHLRPTLNQPDAVKVIARRDSSANGPITTFFARIFGIQDWNVSATATAALTGQSTSEPGELELPVGMSRYFFDEHSCGDHIAFSPANSPESCAGWTSWDYNSNDANLRKILDEQAGYESPGTIANDTLFNFIGGQLSQPTFDALLSLFQRKGYDLDASGEPILDADGNPMHDATGTGLAVPLCYKNSTTDCSVPCDATFTTRLYYADGTARNVHEWPTSVPVYEELDGTADCSNPNQQLRVVGFARIMMDDVCDAPDKIVRAEVQCNYTETNDERGGGGTYGVKGPIPGLVE